MQRRTLVLTIAAFLSGCTTLTPQGTRTRVGRFSLRLVKGAQSENLSGRWRLSETNSTVELTLMTPLYGILARIVSGPDGAILERPNKSGENTSEKAGSAEELMQRLLGFSLPTEMLSSWLSGIPAKNHSSQKTINGFTQNGWCITIKRFKEDRTPALIALTRPQTAQSAAITLNLTLE